RPGADPGHDRQLPERVRLVGDEEEPVHPHRPGPGRLPRGLACARRRGGGRHAGRRPRRRRPRTGHGRIARRRRRGAAQGAAAQGRGVRGQSFATAGAVMRAMRLLRTCLLLPLLAGWLAACGRDPAQQPVRFWAMGREAEVVAELVDEFERDTGIEVEIQQIPWTAAHEKLLTAFAADALPDVCQLGNTWIPEFAQLGALQPLQARVDASATVDQADYFPGIWDTAVVDGELVGVPWYVDTRLLYYRKDLLREAGVAQVPRTWAEWEQAMAAIMAQGVPGRHAILMPLNEFEQQLSFALQQGDPLLRDHDTRGNFESPGFRRALAFYAGMFERGWAPKVSETQISNVWDEFFRGSYVFYLSGPWNIREFRRRQPPQLEGRSEEP